MQDDAGFGFDGDALAGELDDELLAWIHGRDTDDVAPVDDQGDGLVGDGVWTPECSAEQIAAWAAVAPLGEGICTPFGPVDPQTLSQDGRINLLIGLERVKRWVEAQQAGVLAAVADHPEPVLPADPDPDPDPEPQPEPVTGSGRRRRWSGLDPHAAALLSATTEVAFALRWSYGRAADRMHQAQTLCHELPETHALMDGGVLGLDYATALIGVCRELDPTIRRAVQKRVLPRAGSQTVSEFRAAARRAAAALDPRGTEERHADETKRRRVAYQPGEDAMAWLSAYLPAADAQTVFSAIHAVTDTLPDDGRSADQKRADALTTICAAVLAGDLSTVRADLTRWHGRRPSIQVTIALSTLLGLDNQPAELAGYGPIPAQAARRIAADPTGTWHRLLTDDHGHLLHHGRSTYRPPQDLIDHITTRDPTCRAPGCHRTSPHCHLDHIHDWAHGGQTNPDNLDPKCPRHHHLKHDTAWTVHRHPNGTTTWTSPHGRSYHKPPDTHPTDTTRPRTNTSDEPPPF